MSDHEIGDQMSDLMRDKVREVKAEGLSGNVKVLSRRALMDIVDQMIKAYGGLEHQDLISKITEYELSNKQLETRIAQLQGKIEIYESQLSETRKEDDELRAKLKSDETRLPMLEEQNEVLKKTVQGMEAELENVRRSMGDSEASAQETLDKALEELGALKAKVAEMEPRVEQAEAAQADAEHRLHEREEMTRDLEDKVHDVEAAKEKALTESREKIARLEAALQGSDARKRIVDLENELSELKSYLEALEIGLEFVDVEAAPRFEEAEATLAGVDETLGALAPDDGRAAPLRAAAATLRAALEDGQARFPKLRDQMYDNHGTISVVCDLAKILVRQADALDEIRTLKAASELLS